MTNWDECDLFSQEQNVNEPIEFHKTNTHHNHPKDKAPLLFRLSKYTFFFPSDFYNNLTFERSKYLFSIRFGLIQI